MSVSIDTLQQDAIREHFATEAHICARRGRSASAGRWSVLRRFSTRWPRA